MRKLQDQLNAAGSVTDAIYAAGYGSSSRVYQSHGKMLGMTPGSYRAGGHGMSITYALADTKLGKILVAATEAGVCCIEIGDTKKALRQSLQSRFSKAKLKEDSHYLRQWIANISKFIQTPSCGLDLPLDIQGTAFQQRVWKALQAIPLGATASYREVATAIGQPTAQRAVAQACGANKLALVIPCHRVVRTDGDLGRY